MDLNYNMFSGAIPNTLVKLSRLTQLDFSHNLFDETLPYWIGNFSLKLEKLEMRFNSFRGEIPESLL